MEVSTSTAEHSSVFHRFHLFLKTHYFLFFSAFGALIPVLSVSLRSRGLSNAELSLINAIVPFLVFFTNPSFGFIADRSRRYILTFNLVLLTATILFASIFFLPNIRTRHIQAEMLYEKQLGHVLDFCASQEVATQCASRSACGCAYLANCLTNDELNRFDFTFSMSSKSIHKEIDALTDISQLKCGIEYRVPVNDASSNSFFKYHQNVSKAFAHCDITCSIAHFCHGARYPNQMIYLIIYSLLFILGCNFFTNSITLGASLGFASLTDPAVFGQQRLCGTIGFGITALLASKVYEYFRTDYVYIVIFAAMTILCICVTTFIQIQPSKFHQKVTNDDGTERKVARSGVSALIPSLKSFDVIVFLTLAFIWGASYAVLDPYIYLYMDEISPCQSRSIIGYMSTVAAASEVIAFFLAGKILKTFGTDVCSILILLAFAVRFAGYYFIRQPYFFTFMETMHFFNFGILFVLIAQEADAVAPPGLSGTLQGVAYGVCFGLGRGIGLLVCSYIYNVVGQRTLFASFSSFNFLAALLFGLYFLIKKIRSRTTSSEHQTNNRLPSNVNEEPLLVQSKS